MRFAAGLALAAFGAAFAVASACRATEPPAHPMLRIDTPTHAGMVRRLAVDAPRNRLFTAGDDKTIRIWRLPHGRLERVLRVPIDAGHEGKLFALAVSPDGRIVAAGGWTGWEWDQRASLYLFDADTGDMVRRVTGFPEAIGAANFSRDGRFLAVGLQTTGGIRLLRTTDYATVAGDAEYRDKIMALDYAADGRLAVVALDGYLRVYDPQLRLVARVRAGPGQMPSIVRFSPGGHEIAIGHIDAPAISVLDALDLRVVASPDTQGLVATADLSDLAWTADGALYASGTAADGHGGYVFRWAERGRGRSYGWRVADQRITDLHGLPDGGVAFAAEDPTVGILGRDGTRRLALRPDLADFRGARDAFRVSRDGARVQFPYDVAQQRQAGFSLRARELRRVSQADDDLRPPTLASSRFVFDLPAKGGRLVVNGVGTKLMDYELVRSHAFAPDDATLVVGTDWNVRALGADGLERWKAATTGTAWNVAVTGDGRTVVATLADGTIRWYRIEDGVEYLALFPHAASEEWIAWTPAGYYVSSNYGDNLVGWHLNRGGDRAADFFRAVQFERVLYRPDLVDAALRGRGILTGAIPAVRGARFDITGLDAIAPPMLRVEARDASGGSGRATLRITARQRALPMEDLAVFVNNVPVLAGGARELEGADRAAFARELVVDLPERENLVRVEVTSGVSLGLAETYVDRPDGGPREPRPGTLYVLAVGVNEFPGLADAGLAYAARDAAEVARVLSEQGRNHFAAVRASVISDLAGDRPDRARIVAALRDFARNATADDTVVLFLASHGLSDDAGNYYFVPRDARQEDVAAVRRGTDGNVPSLIGWHTFFDALRGAAGRRLLVVDTCRARGIEGRLDLHTLSKRSASSRFALLVASKASEDSQEYPPTRHGLFTHALLEGLGGASDADGDGRVTLQEVFAYVVPTVERLHDRSIGPQTPQLLAPEPLPATALTRATSSRVSARH